MSAHKILTLVFSVFLGGCAVGNKYPYDAVTADIALTGKASVAVAVHDQRNYVLSGEKRPDFVGLQRGGFGNPFDVSTRSGRALAEDMMTSIVQTLKQKGFDAHAVTVVHSDSSASVSGKLQNARTDRTLLLTIREWKSDAMARLALSADLDATVSDGSGTVLARKQIRVNKEVLGAAGFESGNGNAAASAFAAKIAELLDDPQVSEALRGS